MDLNELPYHFHISGESLCEPSFLRRGEEDKKYHHKQNRKPGTQDDTEQRYKRVVKRPALYQKITEMMYKSSQPQVYSKPCSSLQIDIWFYFKFSSFWGDNTDEGGAQIGEQYTGCGVHAK